jgi:hypothetical protein
MKLLIHSLVLSWILIPAISQAEMIEAYRSPNVDFTRYEKRALKNKSNEKDLRITPLGSSRIFEGATLPKVTNWKSLALMQERFETIRDERFLTLSSNLDFPRRISWLYPKDGCFARASLFNRNAFRLYIPIPNKVFAFGNLRVKTENSSRGVVSWWYHVAPIVEVENEKYVLDPAIEPEHPLPVNDWIKRMGNPKKIKVSICGTGTYSPGDNCLKETDGLELRAESTQKKYLALEERELERMGRNPDIELGEVPPWEEGFAERQ